LILVEKLENCANKKESEMIRISLGESVVDEAKRRRLSAPIQIKPRKNKKDLRKIVRSQMMRQRNGLVYGRPANTRPPVAKSVDEKSVVARKEEENSKNVINDVVAPEKTAEYVVTKYVGLKMVLKRKRPNEEASVFQKTSPLNTPLNHFFPSL